MDLRLPCPICVRAICWHKGETKGGGQPGNEIQDFFIGGSVDAFVSPGRTQKVEFLMGNCECAIGTQLVIPLNRAVATLSRSRYHLHGQTHPAKVKWDCATVAQFVIPLSRAVAALSRSPRRLWAQTLPIKVKLRRRLWHVIRNSP